MSVLSIMATSLPREASAPPARGVACVRGLFAALAAEAVASVVVSQARSAAERLRRAGSVRRREGLFAIA